MTASLAQKATVASNAPICETDPEIARLLDSELGRQRVALRMIASENFVPRAVPVNAEAPLAIPNTPKATPAVSTTPRRTA